MSSEWRRTTIEEIAADESSSISIGPFGSRMKSDCYVDSGVPVVRGNNISGGKYPEGDFVFITEEKASELKSSQVRYGDLVFPHRGAIGRVALIPENGRMILSSSLMKLTPSREKCCPAFLLYFFRSKKGVQELLKNASTVGTPGIGQPLTSLKQISLDLPPLKEQKAIAHILGTLDDKIELNRKTNETLEAMAKALFKSWFVDFDPVRAKAEGRPTGLPAEISDLFPDSFEDSELGEIPSGWRVGTIASSVGEVFDGPHATPKKADEGNVFLGIKNMTGSSLDLSDVKLIGYDDWSQWTRRVEPRAGDIVFTYEAALGLFAAIPHGLKCCLGRRMALIRTKASNGAPHFWFHQFIAKPFQKVIVERSIHGATVNRTPLTEFPGYPILEPPETLRLAFDHAASSLWARMHSASNQTASLASLRDALLPKLISGELRIPDAEKMLENFLS